MKKILYVKQENEEKTCQNYKNIGYAVEEGNTRKEDFKRISA